MLFCPSKTVEVGIFKICIPHSLVQCNHQSILIYLLMPGYCIANFIILLCKLSLSCHIVSYQCLHFNNLLVYYCTLCLTVPLYSLQNVLYAHHKKAPFKPINRKSQVGIAFKLFLIGSNITT